MISFDAARRLWILEAGEAALVLGLTPEGFLVQSWFGARFDTVCDYPAAELSPAWASFSSPEGLSREVYPAWGGARFTEPCLKLEYPDYTRDAVLQYSRHSIEGETLVLALEDPVWAITVDLVFEVYPETGLFKRFARIASGVKGTVNLEQVLAGAVYPREDERYRLTHLTGRWIGEFQLQRSMLPEGKFVMESRRGFTSQHANPFFALDPDGKTTEDTGEVWFGELAWSGNWKIVFDTDNFGQLKVSAGLNDFDLRIQLESGQSFETPSLLFGYTRQGFSKMSRNLHAWQRANLARIDGVTRQRRILYNSWEATYFNVNEEGQKRLAGIAAEAGIELFVMDDGWFGERNDSTAGLGDWTVNPVKFPNGLSGLISHVRSLGMEFGLWVEPEMVNRNSALYRNHPDWVYHFPLRAGTEMRDQLVLDLSRAEVQDYVWTCMDRLLGENDISFIKWDLNRSITEPGTTPLQSRSFWVEHIRAVYRIVERLKQKHPRVVFQSCSGGGGRVDAGILAYFDQVWPSDNTDAFDRLQIQEGFTHAYGAHLMESWVTDRKNWVNGRELSLQFRFHVCMTGALGIGEDLTAWTEDERREARFLVEQYKGIRHIVQNGDLYRLRSPRQSCLSAVQYVSPSRDESVLFAFLGQNHFNVRLPRVYPRGLVPNARYAVHMGERTFEKSGEALMACGLEIPLRGDFSSMIVKLVIV